MLLFKKLFNKYVLKFLVCYLFFSPETFAEKIIYIYNGEGVGDEGLMHIKYTLKSLVNPQYEIKEIDSPAVIKGQWKEDAALFIMPGGRDALYDKYLKPIGNENIKSYVNSGGNFLAICGATYYAGIEMEFAKGIMREGKSMEVSGTRELGFFPGKIQGPTLGGVRLYKSGPNGYDINPTGYDYSSYSGAMATPIKWNSETPFVRGTILPVFYNGGPHFVNAQKYSDTVTTLATYTGDGESESAIVECRVGTGKAILCAVHPEFDPFMLNGRDKYLQKILPELWKTNTERKQLMEHLLNRLNVSTDKLPIAKL